MTSSNNHARLKKKKDFRKYGPEALQGSAQEQLYCAAPMAVTGAIASGVAHEINNPLTAVLGFSSALLARLNNNEEIDRKELSSYLQIIHDESIRCRDIMGHFNRFSRDNGTIKDGTASLLECVAHALQLVGMKAARAEVTFINELREDCRVRADAVRIEQVLVSIFLNRIGCCSPGTSVTVSAPIHAGKDNLETVSVTIRDNSAGMTTGDAELFFIVNETEKKVSVGLGFCRRAVEELGGRFFFTRESGRGTTICLDVPAHAGSFTGGSV
jgi:C4-dicarboxylate-specific signal transduction histidine kinase